MPHINRQMCDLYKHMSSLANDMCLLQNAAEGQRTQDDGDGKMWGSLVSQWGLSWGSGILGVLQITTYAEPQFLLFFPTWEWGDWIWDCRDCTPRENFLLLCPSSSQCSDVQLKIKRISFSSTECLDILPIFHDSGITTSREPSGITPPQSWTSSKGLISVRLICLLAVGSKLCSLIISVGWLFPQCPFNVLELVTQTAHTGGSSKCWGLQKTKGFTGVVTPHLSQRSLLGMRAQCCQIFWFFWKSGRLK